MFQLTIDNRDVRVPEGTTVLKAARKAGLWIPTMCFSEGLPPYTSCMICVVRDENTGRLLPACSAPVEEGMKIDTRGEEVRAARRNALELLLSDHAGDCEGPCRLACPPGMDIPRMIRHISAGRFDEALDTVWEHIALPGVLGRICHAPCQKACRRGKRDRSVAICLLKRFVADLNLDGSDVRIPAVNESSGKNVAVVGAGPAGLAAAFHLRRMGHHCSVFDQRTEAGGLLRTRVPEDRLPRPCLDAEIAIIREMGVEFNLGSGIGSECGLEDLLTSFQAVMLACGSVADGTVFAQQIDVSDGCVAVERGTYRTSMEGVYAAGDCVRVRKRAVWAVAEGRRGAFALDRYLSGVPEAIPSGFNCSLGRLREGEMEALVQGSSARTTGRPSIDNPVEGLSRDQAVTEAETCLHCDCRSADDCLLREYASQYDVRRSLSRRGEHCFFRVVCDHPSVIYEPGKCIKCGLCVRLTERDGEEYGLTFRGRGFDVEVTPSLEKSLERALTESAERCVEACPTGALAFRADTR